MQQPITDDPIDKTFGAAVTSLRTTIGLSQRALAKALTASGMSIDASALSRIEQGKRAPKLSEAITIARVLEVDLDELIPEATSPHQDIRRKATWVDRKLHSLEGPLVEVMTEIWEVQQDLHENPELVEALREMYFFVPDADDYIGWLKSSVTSRRLGAIENDKVTSVMFVPFGDVAENLAAVIGHLAASLIEVEDGVRVEHSEKT